MGVSDLLSASQRVSVVDGSNTVLWPCLNCNSGGWGRALAQQAEQPQRKTEISEALFSYDA
ncbi:hypothetical protein B1L02_02605 [Pseudoalteromonas piscicida]|nr:hypothetical protein B1L02_02605 [Pseudoalteromonas piscicida]